MDSGFWEDSSHAAIPGQRLFVYKYLPLFVARYLLTQLSESVQYVFTFKITCFVEKCTFEFVMLCL